MKTRCMATRGAEITLQRRSANRLTGWVSYAYGKTWYKDPTDNLSFAGDYDQRHTLNVFGSYRIRPTINFSTQYRYGSGMPIPGFYEPGTNNNFTVVADLNTSPLPDYSRLDLRGNKTFSFRRFRMTASGEVLNVTDHSNYFFLTQDSMRIHTASQFGSQEKSRCRLPRQPRCLLSSKLVVHLSRRMFLVEHSFFANSTEMHGSEQIHESSVES